MTAVATCPQCQLQLSVPDEADAESVVRCPVCRSTFALAELSISPVLEMIVVPKTSIEPLLLHGESDPDELQLADEIPEGKEFSDPSLPLDMLGGRDPQPLFSAEQSYSERYQESEDPLINEDVPGERTTPTFSDETPLELEDSYEQSDDIPVEATPLETTEVDEIDEFPPDLATESMEIDDRGSAEENIQDWQADEEVPDCEDEQGLSYEEEESADDEASFTSQDDSSETDIDPTDVSDSLQDEPVDIARFELGPARVVYQEEDGTVEQEIAPSSLDETQEPDEPQGLSGEVTPTSTIADYSAEEMSETEEPAWQINLENHQSEESGPSEPAGIQQLDTLEEPVQQEPPASEPESSGTDWSADVDQEAVDAELLDEELHPESDMDDQLPESDEPIQYDEQAVQPSQPTADESAAVEAEADLETDEPPDKDSDSFRYAPLPRLPDAKKRFPNEEGGSSGFRLMGIILSSVFIVGLGGVGLWELWKWASGSIGPRTVADSAEQHESTNVAAAADDAPGTSLPGFDEEFGEPSRYPIQQASATFPAGAAPHAGKEEERNRGGAATYLANPPSYTMNDLELVLKSAKQAQSGLTTGSLNDGSNRFVTAKAEGYARLCELAEVLTFYIDEPERADRTMLLLEAKDIFRQSLREPDVRNDVAQLARLWVDSPKRQSNGDRGILVAGELIDIQRKGEVYEYQLENAVETVSFMTPDRLDRKAFKKGESVVVAGSLVDDPVNAVATYDGDSPRTIWAAVVRVLDNTNTNPSDLHLLDF